MLNLSIVFILSCILLYSITPLSRTGLKSDFSLSRTKTLSPFDFHSYFKTKWSAYVGHRVSQTFR